MCISFELFKFTLCGNLCQSCNCSCNIRHEVTEPEIKPEEKSAELPEDHSPKSGSKSDSSQEELPAFILEMGQVEFSIGEVGKKALGRIIAQILCMHLKIEYTNDLTYDQQKQLRDAKTDFLDPLAGGVYALFEQLRKMRRESAIHSKWYSDQFGEALSKLISSDQYEMITAIKTRIILIKLLPAELIYVLAQLAPLAFSSEDLIDYRYRYPYHFWVEQAGRARKDVLMFYHENGKK